MSEKNTSNFYRNPRAVLKLMSVIWALIMAIYALKYDSQSAGITLGLLVIAYFIVSSLKADKAE